MKVNYAELSWITTSKRLDASFHLSEGRVARFSILKSPIGTVTLNSLCSSVKNGPRFKRCYVDQGGVPFMGSADMMKTDLTHLKRLSSSLTTLLSDIILQPKWILISRSGTVGNVIFTNQTYSNKAVSEHIMVLKPNNKGMSGEVLYAFLASKFGYALLTQSSYGAVVRHIEPHHIFDLKVPIFEEKLSSSVSKLISNANDLRDKAAKLVATANELFLKALDVSKSDVQILNHPSDNLHSSTFTITSDILSTKTFRARNYSVRKQKILEIIGREKFDKLREVLEKPLSYGGRFKRIDSKSSNALMLLSQGELFKRTPIGRSISRNSFKNIEREIVSKGTTLVPGQGTLGENEIFARSRYAYGYLEQTLPAGHIVRFVPNVKKIDSGYLSVVINSFLWFRLMRNTVYGTNLLGFIFPLLESYPIPRFDTSFELKLGSLYKDAYRALTESIASENKAISLIEKEIESWQ